jgi:Flp pilus assembly protein TadB
MDPRSFSSPNAARNRQATIRVPGPLAQLLALAIIVALAALGVLIAIPLLLIGAALLLIFLGVTWVRLKIRRAKAPNGPLDGRHNVRVIKRDE